jgi:hypothetical protein
MSKPLEFVRGRPWLASCRRTCCTCALGTEIRPERWSISYSIAFCSSTVSTDAESCWLSSGYSTVMSWSRDHMTTAVPSAIAAASTSIRPIWRTMFRLVNELICSSTGWANAFVAMA